VHTCCCTDTQATMTAADTKRTDTADCMAAREVWFDTSPAQQIRPEVFYGDRLHRNRLTSEQRRHQRMKRCSTTRLLQQQHLVLPIRPPACVSSVTTACASGLLGGCLLSQQQCQTQQWTRPLELLSLVFLNSVIVVCCRSSDRCAW